jgi:2'-5' RNA ligase
MKHRAQTDQAWRMFCAVDLPEHVRSSLSAHRKQIQQAAPVAQASWSRTDNVHLTLKFLGDLSQASVQNLSEAAAQAVAGLEPFTVRLEQTGVFPSHGSPRVLWIGVNDREGKLAELHAHLEDEAARSGFQKEARQFHPHITVARLREPQDARMLASAHKAMEFEPVEFAVSELLVIRSELSSAGSKYSTISRHPLAAR